MLNITDLHIEEEILPLFDYTHSIFSGQVLREMLTEPLSSRADILARQQILQGFLVNDALLKDYSYLQFNLSDVYYFFETFPAGSFFSLHMRRKLMFSEKERHQKRGKLIILILLFHKLHNNFLRRIDSRPFPETYAGELNLINAFLVDFNLDHYEAVFQKKKKLAISDIVELMRIITEKVTNGQAAAFWKRWFQFEAYLSISHGIVKHGFAFPSFADGQFSLEGIFHPMIKNPVRNDLVAERNVILLTGPNMSGKSTLLKAISLCVYLGHAGLAIPASKASMPFFTTISAAINLTDSIVSGYSHFMSEIMVLKQVVAEAAAKQNCFAVFDELFRGTNIEDALEISTTTIRGLVKLPNSLFIISTHLHQLSDIPEIREHKVSTYFVECKLDGHTPAFTYKLKPGWSDLKLGRILFEREGLNSMLEGGAAG